MDTSIVIVFVGLLVFLAHAFVALFERTKVPDVLFLMIIGLVLGPVLRIVTPEDFGKIGNVFTVIALVVILFEGGMQLSLESLLSAYKQTTKLTLVSYLSAFAGVALLLHFAAGLSVLVSVFVGAVLAGPAPAVVLPLLKHVPLSDSNKTVLTLESALGEALSVIIGLGVISWAAMSSVHVGHMVGGLLSGFIFAAVIGGIGGYLWSVLLNKVRRLQNAMFTTPSFVFIIYGICELLGYSGPVSALAFGIVIGNIGDIRLPFWKPGKEFTPIHLNTAEKAFLGEIVFLLKTFFFVYIGISIRLQDVATPMLAFSITALLILARIFAVRLSLGNEEAPLMDAKLMSVMIPKGLAAAVLAPLAAADGIAGGGTIQNTIYGVIGMSIVLTSALIFLVHQTSVSTFMNAVFAGYNGGEVDGEASEKKNRKAKGTRKVRE